MRDKLKIQRSVYPNSLTSLNILCGFISILHIAEGDFTTAVYFIFGAAFFDLIDGISARLFHSSSYFGVQLDSLGDVVSFGVAPSFMLYKMHFYQFELWGVVLSSLLLIFGAFRLARYNIMVKSLDTKEDFKGLPIPFSALTVCAFVLSYVSGTEIREPYELFLLPLTLLLSFLMVSNVKFASLASVFNGSIFSRTIAIIFLVVSIISVFLTRGAAVFPVFIAIILYYVTLSFYSTIIKRNRIQHAE